MSQKDEKIKSPTLVMPSHGGVGNPKWKFKRGSDLRATFERIKREQAAAKKAKPVNVQPLKKAKKA
jgi:hypothetical protein